MDQFMGIIGVVGGVGPYAGLDLNQKIFDHTIASSDQQHLPVILASFSHLIGDRTRYLVQGDIENPAVAICEVICQLNNAGATVIGIPCNTAHAAPIFTDIQKRIDYLCMDIKLLNMIEEVCRFIAQTFGGDIKVGALSTLGTYKNGLYQNYLEQGGIDTISPDETSAQRIHSAIYDSTIGIKSNSNPVTEEAQNIVKECIFQLRDQGADAVILGCTELPLALDQPTLGDIALIDPTTILARALISEIAPEKLKPF